MPYPSEDACRLHPPSRYDEWGQQTRHSKKFDKDYRVIRGKVKNKDVWEDQAYRYSIKEWNVNQSRQHCRSHKGILFEPSSGRKTEIYVDPLSRFADPRYRIFPLRGEGIVHSHNAIHALWQAKETERFGPCSKYREHEFLTAHSVIVSELRRRGLEHFYEDDLDHRLPLSLKRNSNGYEGEIISKHIVDVACGKVVEVTGGEIVNLMNIIPEAKGVDLKALTEGDSNPFFVVAMVLKVGKSRNKRNYSSEVLKQFRDLHPLPGYLSHQHIDAPELGKQPRFFHQATAWIGAVVQGDELFSKGYVLPSEERLKQDIKTAHAIGKEMVVSITGTLEMVLKEDNEGEYWDVLSVKDGSIDWYHPSAIAGIPGAGSLSFTNKKNKER